MKKKRAKKLRKKVGLAKGELAIIVCIGKHCAPREESNVIFAAARAYANGRLRVERVGRLDVCKKGPIVATLPDRQLHKRVDRAHVEALTDDLCPSS